MKVYIAGKVTGLNYDLVKINFAQVEKYLNRKGYETINPIKIVPEGTDWEPAMQMCLAALDRCQAIYLLDNWHQSDGAKLEVKLALERGLKIMQGTL